MDLKNKILQKIQRPDGSIDFLKLCWRKIHSQFDLSNYAQFNSDREKIFAILNDVSEIPKCFCGNNLNFISLKVGYSKGCSTHMFSSPSAIKKRAETNLKKYGNTCSLHGKDVSLKTKITNQKKYGVEYAGQCQEIKEKMKQTNLTRFGVEHAGQSPEIQAKIKQTNLKRYGVENVYGSKLIREKVKKTNISRRGVEYPSQCDLVKDKVKQKGRKNFIENKLPIYLDRLKDQDIIPLFNPEEYINTISKYKFRHETCGKEFIGNFDNGSIPSCPHCRITGSSQIERKLADDLELTFLQLIRNDRELIKPKEIDIVIDNIGIEVNGVYWHQADVEKTTLLEKSNMSPIQLLHFWDFELYSKYDICLSIIKAKLNRFENKIFARKCVLKKVSNSEAELFFELNHLQGNVKSSYYLGLYFNDELVQCISMGNSRFNKNVDLEIHRIATKLNTTVVGGINKLWKQVLLDFPDKKIITYADKRISNGELYKRLGFTEQKDSTPNYFYVKRDQILPRYQCQKHKLPKLLGDKFNVELTEKENMILAGYIQIKDCGNKVFIN